MRIEPAWHLLGWRGACSGTEAYWRGLAKRAMPLGASQGRAPLPEQGQVEASFGWVDRDAFPPTGYRIMPIDWV